MHMTTKPIPMCGKHHVQKEWRATTFEYSEEGITIRVPNVYAWVCPESNEASFTPGTVDELITTVRELIDMGVFQMSYGQPCEGYRMPS
jgi:YgiT-type zinc finger domain-containing protein